MFMLSPHTTSRAFKCVRSCRPNKPAAVSCRGLMSPYRLVQCKGAQAHVQACELSSSDWIKNAPRGGPAAGAGDHTMAGVAACATMRALRRPPPSPRAGAYTVARTVANGTSVFKLSSHIERLATSANLMLAANGGASGSSGLGGACPAACPPFTAQQLRAPVVSSMAAAVRSFQASPSPSSPSSDPTTGSSAGGGGGAEGRPEVKLTVLLTWGEGGCEPVVWCHTQALPPRPRPPIIVQIR